MRFALISILFSFISISSSTLLAATFEKVVMVVFENTNYKNVINDKNFSEITKLGLLFENMYAETHPSQGNYIAMISGTTHNIKHDNPVTIDGNHIGDLLENKGLTWRVYAEDYPGNCYLKKSSGYYVRKHVPFLSFKNITENISRCNYIQDTSTFIDDVKNNNLPNFSIYIPNDLHNGHDTGVKAAGQWLKDNFEPLINGGFYDQNILFIVTFDEDNFTAKNQIYTAFFHPKIIKNTKNIQKLNHYSILKLIEDEFEIGNLGQNDLIAEKILNLW